VLASASSIAKKKKYDPNHSDANAKPSFELLWQRKRRWVGPNSKHRELKPVEGRDG
jgi:hypothetical protein